MTRIVRVCRNDSDLGAGGGILDVDKFTVYRLLADKELPAFKVGNQWRFKRKMIENWLMKNSNVKRRDTQ